MKTFENSRRFEDGFTLIEVLVAAAITSILAIGLTSMINQVISISDKQERLTTIRSNLTFGLNRMVEDLRRVGRPSDTWEGDVQYRFRGIDGDDQYQNSDRTDERLDDNNEADRMYFHVVFSDEEVGGDRSGRGSVGYFLSSDENKVYQSGTWRLIRFNEKHDDDDVQEGNLVPPLKPDIDSLSNIREHDIAVQVDRLSLRYQDTDGNWHNSWDSNDTSHSGVDEKGDFPVAVEIAIRGYDPNPHSPNSVEPQWRSTTVSLRPRD